MPPRWEPSSDRHFVPRRDQVYAIVHATYVRVLDEPVEFGELVIYIGPEHAQTDRELEILVHEFPDTGFAAYIFHAMPLGAKYRRYREEHPDGRQ